MKINPYTLPIIGAIAGDVVGSPYELKGTRIKTEIFPLFNEKSTFTDDTVLTLAVAKWMMNREFHLADIVHDIGRKYKNVGFGHTFKEWLRSDNPKPYNSLGNGSAMRVSSVGVLAKSISEVLQLAKDTADITHNHPDGVRGAQAVASAVYLSFHGYSKEYIKNFIQSQFNYDLCKTISEIRENYEFDATCSVSVPQAIVAFLESESVEHAIRLAISLGGDADTQASIAGAISAAYFQNISEEISNKVIDLLPPDLMQILNDFNSFVEHLSQKE